MMVLLCTMWWSYTMSAAANIKDATENTQTQTHMVKKASAVTTRQQQQPPSQHSSSKKQTAAAAAKNPAATGSITKKPQPPQRQPTMPHHHQQRKPQAAAPAPAPCRITRDTVSGRFSSLQRKEDQQQQHQLATSSSNGINHNNNNNNMHGGGGGGGGAVRQQSFGSSPYNNHGFPSPFPCKVSHYMTLEFFTCRCGWVEDGLMQLVLQCAGCSKVHFSGCCAKAVSKCFFDTVMQPLIRLRPAQILESESTQDLSVLLWAFARSSSRPTFGAVRQCPVL